MNSDDQLRGRLLGVTAIASDYCVAVESAREADKDEFVMTMLNLLPRLYLEFTDISLENLPPVLDEGEYFTSYVDEDYYESVRRHVEALLGPDDTFLETFEEDMKYSDTPIAASISESLADIFQPLFNFISLVKDTEGESVADAFRECKENFESYWAQTLCNVMRPLNHLRYNS